ncbi:serine hydrolase FSH [Penicillium malachiteum]|uniref:serine hydrolase FSH n=1 Tax=Penicillium malachiteum TaxID=1324776 RepID=UPI0025485B8F|nr:serine hydrolase FSH [Penicillium malachiteum]KAJ5715854.1 serine hydrolase FSH [Penicillium malachiteum]
MPGDQDFYAYYNPDDAATLPVVLDQLSSYVDAQGPFDGVMAFSAGAVLAALYLLQHWQQGKLLPFRFAVFFSTASSEAELAQLSLDPTPGCLKLPTAHIWGQNDLTAPTGGAAIASLCDPSQAFVSVHEGGHEFPRLSKLTEAVHMIRRAIGPPGLEKQQHSYFGGSSADPI